jgi:hypothetical protein
MNNGTNRSAFVIHHSSRRLQVEQVFGHHLTAAAGGASPDRLRRKSVICSAASRCSFGSQWSELFSLTPRLISSRNRD